MKFWDFVLIVYCQTKTGTMRPLFLSVFMLLAGFAGFAQRQTTLPVKADMSNHATVSGDTSYYQYPDTRAGNNIQRFFNRNLRMPSLPASPEELQEGTCDLYFVLDTTGTIVHSWCEKITNEQVAKEVLRVAQKLQKMQPTTIAGKPVSTEVRMSFVFYIEPGTPHGSTRADVVVVGYAPSRKKTSTK
jgi:hypothetical protein